MSKAVTDLSARIRKLELAEARAKALPRAAVLSSKPMSELLGVSWVTLRGYCDEIDGFEASGSFVRGGNGIEWVFKPARTVAYLLKHFRSVSVRQAAKSRKVTKAVGVTLSDDDAPSLAETKDLVNLTLTVTAAQERQHRYAPADEVANFIAGYNEELVSGILGVKTKVDPNGNLPPALRKAVDEELRSLATALHAKAASYIEAKRAGTEQKATR
jgi:hypothetical protein